MRRFLFGGIVMLIYRGIVEVITECSHGRAPHAHRETPDEGLPRQNSPPDCFAYHPAFRFAGGFRALRRDGGISFVIVVLLFAAAHRVSYAVNISLKWRASVCIYRSFVCNNRTETPNFCLRGGHRPKTLPKFRDSDTYCLLEKGWTESF